MKTVDKNNCDGLGNQDHNSPAALDFSAAVLGGGEGIPPAEPGQPNAGGKPAVSCCMVADVGLGFAGVNVFGDQCCGAEGVGPGGNEAGLAPRGWERGALPARPNWHRTRELGARSSDSSPT